VAVVWEEPDYAALVEETNSIRKTTAASYGKATAAR
jgi:hypothetical protein